MKKQYYNFKRKVYYTASVVFPSFFKKRFFFNLHRAFENRDNTHMLPEKEMLVLYFLLDKGHVAVDAGANNGAYSYFFKTIKGAKHVLAFEPLPHLFKKLKIWLKDIDLFDQALSDKKERATIHVPVIKGKLYESRAKLDDLKEENEDGCREIEIQTETLDNVLAQYKPDRLDIIKIDIEGHELKAIEGALQSIKAFKPYLLVEIEARHHGGSLKEAITFIHRLNYQAYFFNFKNKKLESFSEFRTDTMQDMKKQNTFEYINNFLFFPEAKVAEVDNINEQLKNYFSRT